ncbi:hypothetical protein LTR27_000515 [Elasticomyces elasticus]|nr:hypothetical protein LTR27_000515 [Elasticomyces elasticus]
MAPPAQSEEPDLSNEAKLFYNLYMIMMQHFRADEDAQAEKMAEDLIVHASLPVLIRARCYLVLAIAIKNRGVAGVLYAQRAIEVLEEAKEMIGIEYHILPESWDESWIDEAKRVHKLVRDEAVADGDLPGQEVTEDPSAVQQAETKATQTGIDDEGAEEASGEVAGKTVSETTGRRGGCRVIDVEDTEAIRDVLE